MAEFIKHKECPKCGSKDNVAVYSDGGEYCWADCGYKVIGSELREEFKERDKGSCKVKKTSKGEDMSASSEFDTETKSKKAALTEEQAKEIKGNTGTKGKGFRGIRDDISIPFGVRYSYDESSGDVTEQWYPVTDDNSLVGYKIREIPKNFRSKGRTGADCDLFGQFKFNRGGKYVLCQEGEVDALSAYQMLSDYNKSRGSDFEIAVVSPTTGAMSKKQIQNNYAFFDTFDNIILGMDNDEAGNKARDELVKYLPKGKVKIMQMRYKDANEYLMKGKEKEFIKDFYDSKKMVPVGVLPSDQLYDRLMQQAHVEKLPWPPLMGKLNDFFKGGMPLGHIINIAAATSVGKTSVVNELLYYWIFNSSHKCGIVSMELDAGQYAEALLSRHLQRKLVLIEDEEEKIEYLKRPDIMKKANELLTDEEGNPRFYLLDNRDGTVEEIQSTIEELVISCGCKVIVIDVLQDIIAALPIDEQELFLKWSKSMIKSHGITLVYINHTRKTSAGQNAADDEQSIHGSSSIIKSASVNIMLKRDKMNENPIIRNKTEILVHKNRIFGITGPAGSMYYDNETHTLHEFDSWCEEHGVTEF